MFDSSNRRVFQSAGGEHSPVDKLIWFVEQPLGDAPRGAGGGATGGGEAGRNGDAAEIQEASRVIER